MVGHTASFSSVHHASTLFLDLAFGHNRNTAAAVWPAQGRGSHVRGQETDQGRKEPPGSAEKHYFCPVH